MSDDDNTTPESDSEGIKNLRKQFDALKKERDAEREELNTFRTAKRSHSVAEILKAKGLDEAKAAKAATLYSGEDTSEDAVGKWATDYIDVFGAGTAAVSAADPNAESAQRVSDASHGSGQSVQAPTETNGAILGDFGEIARHIKTTPMDQLIKEGYMPAEGTVYNPRR